jgi:anti-sigma regulatory factor (Ser/Thr protein kinase)
VYHPVEVTNLALQIQDSSQVGEARRTAKRCGILGGFSEIDASRLALVVSEAASNLLKHAKGGEILVQSLPGDDAGFDVIVLDRGPGMQDVATSMRDGYSTAGSLGQGLGAIERISDFFELYSQPQHGTALLSRVLPSSALPGQHRRFSVGGVCVTMPGESVCGDAWAMRVESGRLLILVCDGLGHGGSAHEASVEAVRTFHEKEGLRPAAILERIHNSLKSTRGAAAAIAEIDWQKKQLCFVGIGNIACAVFAGAKRKNTVSHYGTLGHEARKFQEFIYPWPDNGIFVICSDGLGTKWSLDPASSLAGHHPSLIAGVLYRDFGRSRDDASVVVVKEDVL